MEQSFVTCIQQTVKLLAETYSFDYEEALALFGTDDLKVATNLDKTKNVASAPKRSKSKLPLPFTGQVFDGCCHAIVFNSGLFTQCLKEPTSTSQFLLCKTCEKQSEKNPTGSPPLGYISDRVERGEDWRDPSGRQPIPYTKVMKAKKFTQEEVMAQVRLDNMNVDLTIFDEPETEKRGRKKGGKKTETQIVFDDVFDEADRILGSLIQEVKDGESETSEMSKSSKTSSKKSKEEREAEKQEKASQKAENDMMKAEEKRTKDFKKEQEKIAKEQEKRAKEQQKEAIKLLKEKKDEEKRLAKEAKEQQKAAKADAKKPFKQIKEEKREKVVEEEQSDKKVDEDPLDEFEDLEEEVEAPSSPMSPPPEPEPVVETQLEDLEEVEVEVEEEEEAPPSPMSPPPEPEPEPEPVVVKQKFRKFKFGGVSYIADTNDIVYLKSNPGVRVGVYTEAGLMLDDAEEEEEDLSDEDD